MAGREQKLKKRYNLTVAEYQELLKKQDDACAICSSTSPGGSWQYFAVDHCHESGAIRGLLCTRCNMGLGYFRDNPQFLTEAIVYLINNKARQLQGTI